MVEFTYNRNIHTLIIFSLSPIVYGFSPLMTLDLTPLSLQKISNIDGQQRVEVVKAIHEKTRQCLKKHNKSYVHNDNKGRKHVVFQPVDWLWVHMQKERFPKQRKSKLNPKEYGHFKSWSASTIMPTRLIYL